MKESEEEPPFEKILSQQRQSFPDRVAELVGKLLLGVKNDAPFQ